MKTIIVSLIIIYSCFGLAAEVNLTLGESIYIGENLISCGEESSSGACNIHGCPDCKSGYSGGPAMSMDVGMAKMAPVISMGVLITGSVMSTVAHNLLGF